MKLRENVDPNYKIDKFRTLLFSIECSTRRLLMKLALGKRKYDYMCRSIRLDPRTRSARMVDIIVRKDAVEERIEADWIKDIARWLDPYAKYKRITPYETVTCTNAGCEQSVVNIDEMVKSITPENTHDEINWGPDVGNEKF